MGGTRVHTEAERIAAAAAYIDALVNHDATRSRSRPTAPASSSGSRPDSRETTCGAASMAVRSTASSQSATTPEFTVDGDVVQGAVRLGHETVPRRTAGLRPRRRDVRDPSRGRPDSPHPGDRPPVLDHVLAVAVCQTVNSRKLFCQRKVSGISWMIPGPSWRWAVIMLSMVGLRPRRFRSIAHYPMGVGAWIGCCRNADARACRRRNHCSS